MKGFLYITWNFFGLLMEQVDSNSKKKQNSQLIWLQFYLMFFGMCTVERSPWSLVNELVARSQGTTKIFQFFPVIPDQRNLVLLFGFFALSFMHRKQKQFCMSEKVSTLTEESWKKNQTSFWNSDANSSLVTQQVWILEKKKSTQSKLKTYLWVAKLIFSR